MFELLRYLSLAKSKGNQVADNIERAFKREQEIDTGMERIREWTIGPNSTFGYCPARKDKE
jgi:hypothetical protein